MTREERSEWVHAVRVLVALVTRYRGRVLPCGEADFALAYSMSNECWGPAPAALGPAQEKETKPCE